MKIRIWRKWPRVWCWYCPKCDRMWRNRQRRALRRPQRHAKYWPLWASEARQLDAWERCLIAAYAHIKRYHSATLTRNTMSEEENSG